MDITRANEEYTVQHGGGPVFPLGELRILQQEVEDLKASLSKTNSELLQVKGDTEARFSRMKVRLSTNIGEPLVNDDGSKGANACQEHTYVEYLETTVEKLSNELSRLKEENKSQAKQIRSAQETAFRQMDTGIWVPQEDKTIRAELKKLEGDLRSWARNNSFKGRSAHHILPPGGMKHILESANEDSWEWGVVLPAFLKNGRWEERSAFLLLQAAISACVFRGLFERPFNVFETHPSSMRGQREFGFQGWGLGQKLNTLYHKLQNGKSATLIKFGHDTDAASGDTAQAHAWRYQTLRLLTAPTNNDGMKYEFDKLSDERCWSLISEIPDSPVAQLCHSYDEDQFPCRMEDLRSLFLMASGISVQLWTQRTHIRVLWKQELGLFKVNSPLMSAHRLHRLDEDDPRLDGKGILVVIQPAVVAFGDSYGENYDTMKVWLKAIVIVEE